MAAIAFLSAATVERPAAIQKRRLQRLSAGVLQPCQKAIAAKAEVAVRMGKELFYRQREAGIAAAYQLAGQTMTCNMMDPAALEGVQAFLEKRGPRLPSSRAAAPPADAGSPDGRSL